MTLNLAYPELLTVISKQIAAGHSESTAFLAWVLENYYRLEEMEAEDAVCDGPDDKGVDGIYVDENENRIDVLQSKISQNPESKLGDVQLKEFAGTLAQFAVPDQIDELSQTTRNKELSGLLIDKDVANLVRSGYSIRGVFVTNAERNQDAVDFLTHTPHIVLIDAPVISASYIPADRPRSVRGPITFDVFGYDVARYPLDAERTVWITSVAASDLVSLEGIANQELFESNVRQWLGKTKVNKDIAASCG